MLTVLHNSKANTEKAAASASSSSRDRDRDRDRDRERERDKDPFQLAKYVLCDQCFFILSHVCYSYQPNVKIEHRDKTGRLLDAKEAWKFHSHIFHGKGARPNFYCSICDC